VACWTDPDERVRATSSFLRFRRYPAITFDSTRTTAVFDSGRERVEESEGVVVSLLITCNAMK